MSICSKPVSHRSEWNSCSVSAPATQPTHSSMLERTSAGTSPRTTTSDTANRPPGLSTRNASAITFRLSRGEVDDAVGDDHVHRGIGERDRLDVALQELDVLDAGLALVLAGERQHLVGHVQAVRLAGRARRAAPRAARRCRRRSPGRAPPRPRAARPAPSGCRSPGRRAPPRPGGCAVCASVYRLDVIGSSLEVAARPATAAARSSPRSSPAARPCRTAPARWL